MSQTLLTCNIQGAGFDKTLGFDYMNNLQNNNMASSFDLLGMSNLSLHGLSSSRKK